MNTVKYILMHIPKSGGTSVDKTISDEYGVDHVVIHNKDRVAPYSANQNPNLRSTTGVATARNLARTLLQSVPGGAKLARQFQTKSSDITYLDGIPEGTKAITGHMDIDTFLGYKRRFPEAKTIVILRDPVEQAWSLYKWLFSREDSNIAPEGYIRGMPFEEFLALDGVKAYQLGYIPEGDLTRFDIVLTTENLSEYGPHAFPFANEGCFPHLNKSVKDEMPISREEALEILGDSPDFDLFNQAKELELKYIREGKYTSAEFQTGMAS